MRNKEEFENAVYSKLRSREKRRRRNITAITSTCAALLICVSATTVLNRHDSENDEAIGVSHATIHPTVISAPEAAVEDENAAVCESPDSAYITGEPEATYAGTSETGGGDQHESPTEHDKVIRITIGDALYVFSADKLSDVMNILKDTASSSDGIAITLYTDADAEQYTLSTNNIAKLLDIIQN